MTTFLPTVLLIFITFITMFFHPFYFEAIVSVNLTVMLVMTTIFTATMDKLPSTAYIKMIDLWLIFGQFVPFIEVLLQTIMESYRERDMEGNRVINHHGRERKVSVSPPPTNINLQPPVSPSSTGVSVESTVSVIKVTHTTTIISMYQVQPREVNEAFVEPETSQGEMMADDEIKVIRIIKFIGEENSYKVSKT